MKKDLRSLTHARDALIKMQDRVSSLKDENGLITKNAKGEKLEKKEFYTMDELCITMDELFERAKKNPKIEVGEL